MKLLIVNDEKRTADIIRETVNWEECGIRKVYTAYDADYARELILEQKIDIVLCDIEMPGENGISLIRWVREQNLNTECIFLTCHANFEYAREAVSLGCCNYILMPARAEEIQETVRKAVEKLTQKRKEEQLAQYGTRWMESQCKDILEKQGEKKSSAEIADQCTSYILNHLDMADLSINMVAEECHLNAIYLNRIFKKEKGMSIGQYIIREKMNFAARLLENPEMTPGAAAVRVGYLNYPYFSTSFKKYFGCSPQKYQEERLRQKV